MSSNKRIVITGGSRGLGKVFAQHLLQQGHQLILTGRDAAMLEQARSELGGEVEAYSFDVTNHIAVRQAFHEIGAVDVLINNAGVLGPVDYFHKGQPDEWLTALDIHLKGTVHCTHAVLPKMVERKQGIVINVSSNAGVFRWPCCSSYSVAKAAIIKLTENLAMETRKKGVAHFAWHPGLVHSVGLAVDTGRQTHEPGTPIDGLMKWVAEEHQKGNTVSAEQSAKSLERLVSGELNALSGRYLTVYDDFDHLLLSQKQIQHDDALMLRIKSPAA